MNMKNLLESKKFNLTIKVLNILLLIVLIAYLIFVVVTRSGVGADNAVEPLVSGKEYVKVEQEESGVSEDTMVNVYNALIQGASAEITKGKKLNFGIDGSFDGFFDSQNTKVTGYTYEIIDPADDCDIQYDANVNIYNADKSIFVQYKLLFDENSNMQLYYPDEKIYMSLLFE